MGKIRRTSIVVETERLLVVRSRRARAQGWCEACGATVRMVGLEEAAIVSGRSQREIVRRVESGLLHFNESARGVLHICLDSLLAEARVEGMTDEA
ncbi:MAG TPA: hypothetical protein VE713_12460 [Pyrinomonadaceae bacterium]|nr:hypothetical protein [Pyrinomonadaceae bacterium]